MRSEIVNVCSSGAILDDVPHDPLRYAFSPGLAGAANAPKDTAFAQAGGQEPRIDGVLDPIRDGHGSDMMSLAHQVNNGPVLLAPLEMGNLKLCCLSPAQPTTQEDPEQRSIPLALECVWVRHLAERPCLVGP